MQQKTITTGELIKAMRIAVEQVRLRHGAIATSTCSLFITFLCVELFDKKFIEEMQELMSMKNEATKKEMINKFKDHPEIVAMIEEIEV